MWYNWNIYTWWRVQHLFFCFSLISLWEERFIVYKHEYSCVADYKYKPDFEFYLNYTLIKRTIFPFEMSQSNVLGFTFYRLTFLLCCKHFKKFSALKEKILNVLSCRENGERLTFRVQYVCVQFLFGWRKNENNSCDCWFASHHFYQRRKTIVI